MKKEEYFCLNKINKRGLSAVVTTLLIILVSIVAVGIIWVVIRNLVSSGSENVGIEKFTLDLSIKSAYVEGTSVKVNVRRSSGSGDLTGINFIFSNSTGNSIIKKSIVLAPTQEQTFSFSKLTEINMSNPTTVSVAPIYPSSSGKDTVGEITDTATIESSVPGQPGPSCGDGLCESSEDQASCPADCTGPGGTVCGDGTCEGSEDVTNCPADCVIPTSCDGAWNPPEDSGVECDGTPLPSHCTAQCTCEMGFSGDGLGTCLLDPPVNNGTIFSVWPIGSVKYIDSEDLPVDVSSYNDAHTYVNFSNSAENGCFMITLAEYLDLNGRSYIRTEYAVNVNAGEKYYIWKAENCGQ